MKKEITISEVQQLDVTKGNFVVVKLPEETMHLPASRREEYARNIAEALSQSFDSDDIRTIVLPYGMQMELMNAQPGSVIHVTMPQFSSSMTDKHQEEYRQMIADNFSTVMEPYDVDVVVSPYGVKVEIDDPKSD